MKSQAGLTLIEMMTVVAVTGILLAITLPLSAFWLERADMSAAKGELSQSFGKAIALALRNEHALDIGQPASALCLSADNQVTVLEPVISTVAPNPVVLPNCAAGTGTTAWSTSLPDDIDVTVNGNAVSCMCFTISGYATDSDCAPCSVAATVDLSIGSEQDTIHVR